MKTARVDSPRRAGYLLLEVLAYLAVVAIVLAVGYAALYRSIDSSVVLHRTADDFALALNTGERWRADVRAARNGIRLEDTAEGQILHLLGAAGVDYRCAAGAVYRRAGAGPWVRLLANVKDSTMQEDRRANALAWRWDLELQPRAKGKIKPGRMRPLFTFLAVPVTIAPQ